MERSLVLRILNEVWLTKGQISKTTRIFPTLRNFKYCLNLIIDSWPLAKRKLSWKTYMLGFFWFYMGLVELSRYNNFGHLPLDSVLFFFYISSGPKGSKYKTYLNTQMFVIVFREIITTCQPRITFSRPSTLLGRSREEKLTDHTWIINVLNYKCFTFHDRLFKIIVISSFRVFTH